MRTIITLLVLISTIGVGLLFAVAVTDPLTATVTGYDLGGMESQVNDIHVTLVKYMAVAAIASALIWAVFNILQKERQQL